MFGDYRGKRVTVMGLGRFGGGVGATRFLAERGARVTVTDSANEEVLAESLSQIADLRLERLRLGGHDEADFLDAELIVASPAVPPEQPLLRAAEARGVLVTTEIGLFWAHCRGRIVGVTGSVGKSTTSAMIHAVFTGSGRPAWLGGNIGVSLLPDIDAISREDWVVLELSSFQLERLAPLRPRPAVAVVTNFRPNHLDRHGTLDCYRTAKQTLLRFQTPEDVTVLNADDPDVAAWPTLARVRFFSARDSPKFSIPGEHHRSNVAAAAAVAGAIGVEPEQIARSFETFRGLPHRMEVLGEVAGRLWVNDSKATTPESVVAALRSFDRPVRLVAGGADKGVDLSALADEIAGRGVATYVSGRTAPVISQRLAERGHGRVTACETFEESVAAAWTDSQPGDVILLSPACASWGQFRDYRERGERFAHLAEALAGLRSGRLRR